jgi:creatinine amidohydrolase
MPASLLIAEMTWTEFQQEVVVPAAPVLLPVGAMEQHGWHLPLGTDWIMASEIARLVAQNVGGFVAPPLCYGYKSQVRSGGGDHRIGTTSLSGNTLIELARDVLVGLGKQGARKLAVIDGHYENGMFLAEACDLAATELKILGLDVTIVKCMYGEDLPEAVARNLYEDDEFPGLALEHAGLLETSMMLHCFPEMVRDLTTAENKTAKFPPYDVFPVKPEWVPVSGSLAGSSGSSAEKGKFLVDRFVNAVSDAVRAELCS